MMRHTSNVHSRGSDESKAKVAILLTDGISNVDKQRTVLEARLARQDGIVILVIG